MQLVYIGLISLTGVIGVGFVFGLTLWYKERHRRDEAPEVLIGISGPRTMMGFRERR
jgi:hypothetical protein